MDTRTQYLPSDQVRDTLGRRMAWVHDTGGILVITDSGNPDGALVPPGLLAEAGLAPVRGQGVREARAHWGATRTRAAVEGPQGLTHHKNLLAVLVDQTTAAALIRRLPVLAFTELDLTGIALADGEPIAPGEYAAHDGKTLRIRAPQQEETTVDNTTLNDPETPEVVIFETLRGTANRAAAAYMRAAEAATTPEAKEDAKQQMKRTWRIKSNYDLSRGEMIALIQQLQGEIDQLREA
ncbi:hypothetical protein [Nocardiopsis dassonvillei]|uniref:hypothetical protein n=1 Tax=Nocardiopsis dassonvillei TaxID=2014 RepID=UPI000B9D6B6B|nr:hypothetical protein [Nocardiopsis dassonvillei]ASU60631.1 hypothetical protein CGQ36_25080 [Nocardiopsis dassonvillei]